jgi:hypothetical protein
MDGYTKIVGQTVTQTVQRANNKKTDQNISKLKTYFAKNESKTRQIFK